MSKSEKYTSRDVPGACRLAVVAKFATHPRVSSFEKGGGISMTVPGEAISLNELLTQYVRYGTVAENAFRSGHYADTEDFDDVDLEKLSQDDLVEQASAVEEIRSRASEADSELKRRREKAIPGGGASQGKAGADTKPGEEKA